MLLDKLFHLRAMLLQIKPVTLLQEVVERHEELCNHEVVNLTMARRIILCAERPPDISDQRPALFKEMGLLGDLIQIAAKFNKPEDVLWSVKHEDVLLLLRVDPVDQVEEQVPAHVV